MRQRYYREAIAACDRMIGLVLEGKHCTAQDIALVMQWAGEPDTAAYFHRRRTSAYLPTNANPAEARRLLLDLREDLVLALQRLDPASGGYRANQPSRREA